MKFLYTGLFLALGALAAPVETDALIAPLHPLPFGAHATGTYIVVLKDTKSAADVLAELGIAHLATSTYTTVLNGFSGRFDEATLSLIRASPFVDFVEQDVMTEADVVQHNAPYNLAIESEANRLEPNQQNTYHYVSPAGQGVGVYILDTGININNVEFGGRAINLISYYGTDDDVNGHGTNVAGIAGGHDYGIAKSATIYNVKVLGDNGKGNYDYLISGIDYSVSHNNNRRAVINMSIGGPVSQAVARAVQSAFNAGVFVVSSAGNNNTDACNQSPGESPYSFTVAASNAYYQRAHFSNFGNCVNIFAPGVDIISAGIPGTTDTSTLSGTSQAAPAVAGIAAYFLAVDYSDPRQLGEYIVKYAQHGLITGLEGSPNILVNNGFSQNQP